MIFLYKKPFITITIPLQFCKVIPAVLFGRRACEYCFGGELVSLLKLESNTSEVFTFYKSYSIRLIVSFIFPAGM